MRAEKGQGRLAVYFKDPFWIGVFEMKQQRKKEKHKGH